MAMTAIEQAVFGSENRGGSRGYQLLGQSPGINAPLARDLITWSPAHDAMLSDATDSPAMTVFPIGDDYVACGKTVYGLPEYSGRGGFQLVTRYAVFHQSQFAGFACDVVAVWLYLQSRGLMLWQPSWPARLPLVPVPERWVVAEHHVSNPALAPIAERVEQLIRDGRRVAVVGCHSPEVMLRDIVRLMPVDLRSQLSAGLGLRPSTNRPFQLQFLPEVDLDTRACLSAEQVVILRQEELVA